MILDRINGPKDLKTLNAAERKELAQEIHTRFSPDENRHIWKKNIMMMYPATPIRQKASMISLK